MRSPQQVSTNKNRCLLSAHLNQLQDNTLHTADWLTELRFYIPLHTKIGHFVDVLLSQSLGMILKKLHLTVTKLKQTTQEQNRLSSTRKHKMLNLNKCTKTKSKPKPTLIFKCVCVSLCTTVAHNAAQNSSDNVPSYRPDNHHSWDDVYWREETYNWVQWHNTSKVKRQKLIRWQQWFL